MIRSVTRQLEPEWDSDSRALAEALHRHDAEVCPGCGLHKSIRDDPEANRFTVAHDVCMVCAGIDVEARRTAARDAEHDRKHPTPEGRLSLKAALKVAAVRRPEDGRHAFLRSLTPEEIKQQIEQR